MNRFASPEQWFSAGRLNDCEATKSGPNYKVSPRSEARHEAPPEPWRRPSELPDLRRVGIIALDTETNDEGLRADRGSAWPWHGGYVCGISVAWREDSGIRGNYFPLRHPDSENFERENVSRWLKDHIAAGVRIRHSERTL